VGKRAAAIAALLSLSFLGSLLALALVGERQVVGHLQMGRPGSPLPPGVEAPPVHVDVPEDGSPRPGIGARPVGAAPTAAPEAGQAEPPQTDQAKDTPPEVEPPAPATEPPQVEQPPPADLGTNDGTTHLKTDGEDQDGTTHLKIDGEDQDGTTHLTIDGQEQEDAEKEKKLKDEEGGPECGQDQDPKDKMKDEGKAEDEVKEPGGDAAEDESVEPGGDAAEDESVEPGGDAGQDQGSGSEGKF
jgi:hypothetical protein